MTKREINAIYNKSRDAKLWAGEAIARAAEYASIDDADGFRKEMEEASRLALRAAELLKAYRAAVAAYSKEA